MTWSEVISQSFQNVWEVVIGFLPSLIGALIIILVGIPISVGIGKLVKLIFEKLLLDKALEKLGVLGFFRKLDLEFTLAGLLGWLVKWFLIIVFFVATFETLGLTQITDFLNEVVEYLPNVIVAVIVLLLGIVAGNFVHDLVKKGVRAAKFTSVQFLAGLSKWAIVIFAFMAALIQLGIAPSLINTLFTGFVAMLALAGGLAFGLGGKDLAQNLLMRLKKDISERE